MGGIAAYIRAFIIVFVSVPAQPSADAEPFNAQSSGAFQHLSNSKSKPHSNHNPQHGGVFFMALDNQHHLEGVLLESKVFEVYLYDEFTKPLSTAKVQQVSGIVQVEESDNAPRIPLVVGKNGHILEAFLSKDLRLPVTITLSPRFEDLGPNVRPEVFTFPFSHYIAADSHSQPPAPTNYSRHGLSGTQMDH